MQNRPQMMHAGMEDLSCSVFVGNIPYTASEDILMEVFETVGAVVELRLERDDQGAPKGFGFCKFRDPEAAHIAIRNLNNYEMNGRLLRVENARDNIENRSAGPSLARFAGPGPDGPGRGSGGMGPGGMAAAMGGGIDDFNRLVNDMTANQIYEVMKQLRDITASNRDQAKALLVGKPQAAVAFLRMQDRLNMLGSITLPPPPLKPQQPEPPIPQNAPPMGMLPGQGPPLDTRGRPAKVDQGFPPGPALPMGGPPSQAPQQFPPQAGPHGPSPGHRMDPRHGPPSMDPRQGPLPAMDPRHGPPPSMDPRHGPPPHLMHPNQRDARDARDLRDSRDQRDGRDPRDMRDSRESRDMRDPRDQRDPRDFREPMDFRDTRPMDLDPRHPRDGRPPVDPRDLRPNMGPSHAHNIPPPIAPQVAMGHGPPVQQMGHIAAVPPAKHQPSGAGAAGQPGQAGTGGGINNVLSNLNPEQLGQLKALMQLSDQKLAEMKLPAAQMALIQKLKEQLGAK